MDGNAPRNLVLNDDRGRRSSADTIGESGDNETNGLKPNKRRKRETVISPVESNYSLRGRNKASPLITTFTSNTEKPFAKAGSIPGIQVSQQDDSISPVSEIASLADLPPAAKQSMRFNLNAKGEGKIIISNAVTPATSRISSRRTSPSFDVVPTQANTPEESSMSKQLKKPTGRRRNPHQDPKIEAAIRRQAELRTAYRAVSRAMKPLLVELSTRGVDELEDDVEAHKRYPEYIRAMAALDYFYEMRQAQLDAQKNLGLKLADQMFKQDSEYILMQNSDLCHELQEQFCLQQLQGLIRLERMISYEEDGDMTEDDFEEDITPLRKADAYLRDWNDPRRNLNPVYDSRSRRLVLTGEIADDIGKHEEMSRVFAELQFNMKEELDEEYGDGFSERQGLWVEQDYIASFSDVPEKDNINLLLEAANLDSDQLSKSNAADLLKSKSSDEFIAFDALLKAIDMRQPGDAVDQTGSEETPKKPRTTKSTKNGIRPESNDSGAITKISVALDASANSESSESTQGSIASRVSTVKSRRSETRLPRLAAGRVSDKDNHKLDPEIAYRARIDAMKETPTALLGTFPTDVDWDWVEPQDNVTKLLALADYRMEQADQLETDYNEKIQRNEIKALSKEDEEVSKRLYRQPRREEQYKDKSWLEVRKIKLAAMKAKKASGDENSAQTMKLKSFTGEGEYVYMGIPYEYAKLCVCRDKMISMINLWEMTEKDIPEDAFHIADRYRFMELADQVHSYRVAYYLGYLLWHNLFTGLEQGGVSVSQERKDNFLTQVKAQKIPMMEREEELKNALEAWETHKALREAEKASES